MQLYQNAKKSVKMQFLHLGILHILSNSF